MRMPLLFSGFLFYGALVGCVGGTLSNHNDIEIFPLRTASENESKSLKRCLKAAHRAQEQHLKKTGKRFRKSSEFPVDDACNGLLLRQVGNPAGHEIWAEIRDEETTVRWSVNQKGVIEEHFEDAPEGDLEL